MSIIDIAQNDIKKFLAKKLEELFGIEEELQFDPSRNSVVVEGIEFTYHASSLRLLGQCPICGQDVPSVAIKRKADVYDLTRHFKPAKHDCIDV